MCFVRLSELNLIRSNICLERLLSFTKDLKPLLAIDNECHLLTAFSGVGGQVDFLRGAALGADGQGKPILAMNSVTKKGESKITPFLKPGKFMTGNQSMLR